MAGRSQTVGDLVTGSVHHKMDDINSQHPADVAAHNGIDRHVPFPIMPSQVSPLPARDFHPNGHNLPCASLYDLNLPFDANHALDHNFLSANDFPFMDYPVSGLPDSCFDATIGSGFEGFNNMMDSYHESRFPHFESTSDANPVSFSRASGYGTTNMHTAPPPGATQCNREQMGQVEMYSTPTEFRGSDLRRRNTDIVSGEYSNQFIAPQSDFVDRLEGDFLSLGCESNPTGSGKSNAHMFESPFPPHGQLGNLSHSNMGGRLAGFQNNIHDLDFPSDNIGNLTLTQSDHSDFQAKTSAFGLSPIPMFSREQFYVDHVIPTPRMPELEKETDSRISASDPSNMSSFMPPFDRRLQRVPFDSSILRSNHQNAADSLQMSHGRTDQPLPRPVDTTGGTTKRDKLDLGAATAENQISHSSTAVARESLKRNLDSPHQAMMNYQRRKIMSQSSTNPFSSHLLQNALGEVQSMPSFPTSTSSSPSASAALNGSVSSDSTTYLRALSRAQGRTNTTRTSNHPSAFISPTHLSNISLASPRSFRNTSSYSGVAPEGPMMTPLPAYPPPTLMSPSISGAPSALASTAPGRTGTARIPVPASRRLVSRSFPPLPYSPSPVSALRKTSLSRASSRVMTPDVAALKRASLQRAALQSPPTVSHIKWQGPDTNPTLGLQCTLCKRDLSYEPEGPISVPSVPPPVAVLPCGHTFHDQCLARITPDDQSNDPPCIPCAIAEK